MAVSGKGGTAKLGANQITEVSDWKLDIDVDTLDHTNEGSAGWKEFIAGLKSWTGSISGFWNVSGDANGQATIQSNLLAGTALSLALSTNGGTNSYSGSAIIKKQSISAPVNGVVAWSADFQGTAALTYA